MFQNDPIMNAQSGELSTASLDMNQAEALAKTLQVGHAYASGSPTSLTGAGALQMESIDATLKSVLYEAKNLVLYPSLPQDKAYSLVEQFVRTNSVGDGGSVFVSESASPVMNDSEFQRAASKVVFFATRRGVSLPATLVRMNFGGDLEGKEAAAGSLWMLERVERACYKAMSDYTNDGHFDGALAAIPGVIQNLELDGLERQIRSADADFSQQVRAFDGYGGAQSVVKDLAGNIVDETSIEDEAEVIMENFGMPQELHLAPKQLSDFVKQFLPKERVMQLGIQDARAGYVVRTFATSAGDIGLKANIFLKPKENPKSQNDRANVPNAPASVTPATSTPSDTASKLKAGDKYSYSVAACSEAGESASIAATSADTVIAVDGDIVTLAIAAPSSGVRATHFAVYRTSKAGGTAAPKKFIGYVKTAGTSTVFKDRGERTEGSATAFMLDLRPEILVWKQLAPMMKIALAQVSLSKEFILWMAATLQVFNGRKLGVIQNIGRST